MSGELILALDIGGTNARGEVVDEDLNVITSAWLATPTGDGDGAIAAIAQLCHNLLKQLPEDDRTRVRAVGLGVPGIVDSEKGIVRLAANLGWVNAPVAADLGAQVGLPVILHHDVTVAGLAEREQGAGRGVDDLLAVFIGTGVAATIVVDGKAVAGGLHQAGELGHVPIRENGLLCPCGQHGCLEMYCSARSIGMAYAQATGRETATSLDVVNALGTDPVADEVWSDAIDALTHALLGVITMLSPQRIVIGGGLSAANDVLVTPLRERLVERTHVAVVPEIVIAELGQRAGITGAAIATFQRLQRPVAVPSG